MRLRVGILAAVLFVVPACGVAFIWPPPVTAHSVGTATSRALLNGVWIAALVPFDTLAVEQLEPDLSRRKASGDSTPAERTVQTIRDLGVWAPLGLIALLVLLCILCVPAVFLPIAAGALFGLGWGFVYTWIGVQLGASAGFFISRRLARDWVARRLGSQPLLSALEEAVALEGWKIVGLLRLAPGAPYFLLNYLFGLTRVPYRDYAWATAIGSIPGVLFFTYLGSLGHLAIEGRLRSLWDWSVYTLGLAALGLASALVAHRARRVLRVRLRQTPPA
jgi:uncharacterized membrane protein YdjX (TVP38/TMEM64 family)